MEYLFILALGIIIALSFIRVIPQNTAFVIERFGAFHRVESSGVHCLIPGIDRIVNRIALDQTTLEFNFSPILSKDNVKTVIDCTLSFYVTDPKAYSYNIGQPKKSLETLTSTLTQKEMSSLLFDEVKSNSSVLSTKIQENLKTSVPFWGVEIQHVEIKDISALI